MGAAPRKLLAGNWKMNGLSASIAELDAIVAARVTSADLMICPPSPLIASFADKAQGSAVAIGAQDCHMAESGAHTGDVSAALLADIGAAAVIVGHSERRADHGENDAMVKAKASAARSAGLDVIVCVGETEAERDAGRAEAVVVAQIAGSLPDSAEGVIVAYEPVWAIGTGRVPVADDIVAIHQAIRAAIAAKYGESSVRILYGGSVKPSNAAEILHLEGVDGALIGGASLKAVDFLGIAAAV